MVVKDKLSKLRSRMKEIKQIHLVKSSQSEIATFCHLNGVKNGVPKFQFRH